MILTLNGIQAVSVKLTVPWRGVWHAEIQLAAESVEAAQALFLLETPATLVVGTSILLGTVDPKSSGTLVSKAIVRVVGGRNGWGKTLSAQAFGDPSGLLLSSVVYAATGAAVGEVVIDSVPQVLGDHFVRVEGPASDIFAGRDWRVDPITSTTIVGPRVPLPLNPLATIVDFQPLEGLLTISSEDLISPATLVLDTDGRLNGQTLTIRDVIQTFDSSGSVAECYVSSNETSRIDAALKALIQSASSGRYLSSYRYRVVFDTLGSLTLQAASPGAPDIVPLTEWVGVFGLRAQITPGTEIVVGFAEGDPRYPFIQAYLDPSIASVIDPVAKGLEVSGLLSAIYVMLSAINVVTPLMVLGYSSLTDPQKATLAAAVTAFQAAVTPATIAALNSTTVFTR